MANNFNDEQNKKDLKFYKFVIAFAIFSAFIIALGVGISQMGTYTAEAFVTNAILNKAMPTEITDDTEGSVTYGMTFYREKNEDFNAKEDIPINAFNYYYINDNDERVYLEDGTYYPAGYYNENQDEREQPIAVAFGFVVRAQDKIQQYQKIGRLIVGVFVGLIIVALIYIWYRVWSKREDEKEEMKKKLAENAKKK